MYVSSILEKNNFSKENTMNYRIAIGVDHRGFELKTVLVKELLDRVTWIDVGTFSAERTDYPPFAQKVVHLIQSGEADLGVLACGSGVGIAIAANRYPHIYAGVAWNEAVARSAKEDDNVNILVLPADFISDQAMLLVKAWLGAEFKGGRYQKRLEMIDQKWGRV